MARTSMDAAGVRWLLERKSWSVRRVAHHFNVTEDAVKQAYSVAKRDRIAPDEPFDFTDADRGFTSW